MCGIAGIFDRAMTTPESRLHEQATAMARIMAHRGPDDEGVWTDPACGVALAQRRLSIIDCSPAGHQPMASACGRYVITYNGETYNYRELESQLRAQGCVIEGGSDTAILLAACVAWGVEETLRRCVGMFAFILWDRQERSCTLARDRLGVKPLYWGRFGELFLFGSQIKALRAHGGFPHQIDRDALASYMRYAYVPAPATIYHDIWKLPAGHFVTIPDKGEPGMTCYWDLRSKARSGYEAPFPDTYEQATDTLEGLLLQAVGDRMIADVPLGAFLSGGVDSSCVAALMQRQSHRPVRTFSIGFEEQPYDESGYAAAVARHLGTDHTALFVTSKEARDLIPLLPNWYDEPFADSSQLPTLALSRLTSEHVTVALSGDGGDEVFAGYNRYFWAERLWNLFGNLPRPARKIAGAVAGAMPPGLLNRVGTAMPGNRIPRQLGDKVQKLAGIIDAPDMDAVYRQLVSQWPNSSDLIIGGVEYEGILRDETVRQDRPDIMGRMQLLDMATYLPDDILTKVDRASMAFSLEARVPLIDHRVVEFAWSLPRDFLVRNGHSKSILRDVLYRHVPKELIERPKMGFGIPLDTWLRGPLRDWAEDLLNESRLRQEGYFNPAPVRQALHSHMSGAQNMSYGLWTVLMFQAWLDHDPLEQP